MNKLLLLLVLLYGSVASADAIDMRDYNLLKNGMTEAEVLYRVGPYDHETIKSDHYNHIFSKTWFYIPSKKGTNKWITELKFNGNGVLISRDRYRVK